MRGHPPISPIWRLAQPAAERDPERRFARVWSKCRDLWVEHGTIAVRPDELPAHLRDQVIAWAEEAYGKRSGKPGAALRQKTTQDQRRTVAPVRHAKIEQER